MLKKTIKYVDYEGNEREEDFYFNLNKAELFEMRFSGGDYRSHIEKIIKEQNMERLLEHFKEIILSSYGEKVDGGRRFAKSKEMRDAFEQSEAFVELYMELVGDEKAAASFVTGIIPKEFQSDLEVPSNKTE